jgi:hypothetical protein
MDPHDPGTTPEDCCLIAVMGPVCGPTSIQTEGRPRFVEQRTWEGYRERQRREWIRRRS